MNLLRAISTLILAAGTAFSQAETTPAGSAQPHWQKVDQLCGQLELTKPANKTIIVNGKREERSYETYLNDAEVFLHRGANSDTECCGGGKTLAHTRSRRFGAFELPGFEHGLYWLEVKKGNLRSEIPLRVTEDFNARKCHAPEVGRSFIVDSKPPSVQVRIR